MKPSNYPIPFPCFPNTDVPLACLFIHLEKGYSLDQFLQDFPSVSEAQVRKLLGWTIESFKQPHFDFSQMTFLVERTD